MSDSIESEHNGLVEEMRDSAAKASALLKALSHENRLLILSEQITRVSVAEPRVADLKVITPTQVLLTAKGVGTTDLTLWNRGDDPLVLALRVSRDLEATFDTHPVFRA